MDVFLVPTGAGRYELYCEARHEVRPLAEGERSGFLKRAADRFMAMLAAVEREHERFEDRAQGGAAAPPARWTTRLRARVVRWMAAKVAEQRLLWHLRSEDRVTAHYPAGMETAKVVEIVRASLSSDFERHRVWLAVNAVGGVFSLLLVPFPGPNVIGFYFTFRIFGHLLALRGARHGLDSVRWDLVESPPLADLGTVHGLPSPERERRVEEIGRTLGLARLPRFFERTVTRAA